MLYKKDKPMKTPSVKREFMFVIVSKAVMWTLVNEDEIAISCLCDFSF